MDLRVDYLRSPTIDQVSRSLESEHDRAGHRLARRASIDEIPLTPAPDVAFHMGVSETLDQPIVTTCMLNARLPKNTLLIPSFQHVTPSDRMLAAHILRGRCHRRVLLHRPHDQYDDRKLIEAVERGVQGEPRIETAGPVSEIRFGGDSDLGEIMAKRSYASMLYLSAKNPTLADWTELAEVMGLTHTVVRNRSINLGRELKQHGIIGHDERWSAWRFARLVATYSSFIIGYWLGHYETPE